MVPKYCFRVVVSFRQVGISQPKQQEHSFDHLNDALSARDRHMKMKNTKRVTVLMVLDEIEKWDTH